MTTDRARSASSYTNEVVAMADDNGQSQGQPLWRVVVRVSFYRDRSSRLRNYLVPLFAAMGLRHTHTGTWESSTVDIAQAAAQMNLVFQTLANPQAVAGVDAQAALNHLWV